MQSTKMLNGDGQNQDYDVQLLASNIITVGVVSGLEVTLDLVSKGKGFIEVTRDADPTKTFYVQFELTEDLVIDTSGTKKVFVEITQENVDTASLNTEADGTGIGEIKIDTNYPSSNYIPLASIVSGSITDEREIIVIKESKIEDSIVSIVTPLINNALTTALNARNWKDSCRAATTEDITLSGEQTIDTVSIVTGDRVLVMNQDDAEDNGIYVADSSTWSRAEDFNTSSKITAATVGIEEGDEFNDVIFFCIADAPDVGVDAINFVGVSSNLTPTQAFNLTSKTKTGDDEHLHDQFKMMNQENNLEYISQPLPDYYTSVDSGSGASASVLESISASGSFSSTTGTRTARVSTFGVSLLNQTGMTYEISFIAKFSKTGTSATEELQGAGLFQDNADAEDMLADVTTGLVRVALVDGSLKFQTADNGASGTTEEAVAGVTAGDYNHYRIVFEDEVNAKLYVNGVLKNTITTTLPSTSVSLQIAMGLKNFQSGGSISNNLTLTSTRPFVKIVR